MGHDGGWFVVVAAVGLVVVVMVLMSGCATAKDQVWVCTPLSSYKQEGFKKKEKREEVYALHPSDGEQRKCWCQ